MTRTVTRTATISEDEKLFVEKLREHDEEAFEKLVRDYKKNMLRIARRILGKTNVQIYAEDAVQQTFLSIFLKIKSFRGESAFYTWVHRILTNQCLDICRRSKVRPESLEKIFDLNPCNAVFIDKKTTLASNLLEQKELRQLLIQALSELEPNSEEAIFLRYYYGFETREVANRMGINENTIKVKCFRGLGIIHRRLVGNNRLEPYIRGFTN